MDGADKILHWRLMREADEVTHMVDNEPCQMLRIMEVLALKGKNQNIKPNTEMLSNSILQISLLCFNVMQFYSRQEVLL